MNAADYLLLVASQTVILALGISCHQFESDTCPPGSCIPVESCPEARDLLAKGGRPKICGFQKNKPMTCCLWPTARADADSDNKTERKTISSIMCEQYRANLCPTFSPYVYGGKPALPKELPFMAHIGYGEKGDEIWQCGGSLISTRYVLSAAHCTDAGNIGPASWAKLGDLDTSTDKDDASPEILKIVVRYNHPGYKPSENYNDIALYRLEREVVFNKFIRPICLQSTNTMQSPTKAQVAGWGRIGFVERISSKLLKADLDILNTSNCSLTAGQLPRGMDSKSMICAGAEDGARDSCLGDSGGPLYSIPITTKCQLRTQYGVTSFGYQCGLPEYPGVYTNVSYHMKWIESIVWPFNSSDPTRLWSD